MNRTDLIYSTCYNISNLFLKIHFSVLCYFYCVFQITHTRIKLCGYFAVQLNWVRYEFFKILHYLTNLKNNVFRSLIFAFCHVVFNEILKIFINFVADK